MDSILYSSRSEEWSTPDSLFLPLHREFGFTLDVAASPANAKCERYFTKEDDGLSKTWDGVFWMNPPYGREIGTWMLAAMLACHGDGRTGVALVPARTDTDWFYRYVWGQVSELRFVRGRLKFGDSENSATFPSVVIVYRPNDLTCQTRVIDRLGATLWNQ